jgi:hypothetical protein
MAKKYEPVPATLKLVNDGAILAVSSECEAHGKYVFFEFLLNVDTFWRTANDMNIYLRTISGKDHVIYTNEQDSEVRRITTELLKMLAPRA